MSTDIQSTIEPRVETATGGVEPPAVQAVTLDLYRDVHKGIRSELFAVTEQAGRLDPADGAGRADLASQVSGIVRLLAEHAEHEDAAIEPVLRAFLPELAERIAADHEAIEGRLAELDAWAAAAAVAPPWRQRAELHALYVELASFTAAYLAHQDVEERVVMPALEAAAGVPAVVEIHGRIVGGMPPEELVRGLAVMLPAMNVDDRVEMLGGIRQSAPPEAFAGVWSLAGSVLPAADHEALAVRLGVHAAA